MQKNKKDIPNGKPIDKSVDKKQEKHKEDLDDYIFKEQNNKKCSEK